mmetsp:Transcript_13039/g.39168  ORF Transcript_13039/g.39168 Transcript_13039/m.39168 type:complete len:289 (-) Transcript_13039:529-1395(-)
MVATRVFVPSSSATSKRVEPSRALPESTERFPFFAMASPCSVTTLQLRPRFLASPNEKLRPSVIVSAKTTSPRRNSNAWLYRSSKVTQLSASRRVRLSFTSSASLGSRGGTRRSFKGRKVMGGSMRSLRYFTHLRAASVVSTMIASRNFPSATFTATCRRFCVGWQRSTTRPCTPWTASARSWHTLAISRSFSIWRSVAAASWMVSSSCCRSCWSCSFSSAQLSVVAWRRWSSKARCSAFCASCTEALAAASSASLSSAILRWRCSFRAKLSRWSCSALERSAANAEI